MTEWRRIGDKTDIAIAEGAPRSPDEHFAARHGRVLAWLSSW
ncbi:hypothetical protein [Sphingomonas xinjiangensis]|uniref:Uncharacterized protein n=1 Tax=Sphingomonas xinjiangensis TaxID=643568 RepID=A0A840YNY6_9SPHN|nr:hypothetical protein [Sphingomonas xinjiangensis]MBB5711810.1 hypothetical protein [Sphingomonas xinjiangensis]